MSRTIFAGLSLFKQEVTERFLVAAREIYKNHPIYTFDNDQQLTKILLYPSYADIGLPGKTPKIIIKAGGYNFGMTDTLFGNMSGEAKDAAGHVAGYTYSKMMVTTATALVQAYAEEESADLADELSMLAVFACRNMFSQVGLVIRGVQVSETDVVAKEEGLYQTVISIALDAPWGGTIINNGPPIDDVVLDPPVVDVPLGTFRTPPGLETYRQFIAETKP
jgi:hypothetical protein